MLLKNISVSSGLVNGARGVIKEFRNGVPVVQFRNKKEYTAQREQWIVKTAGTIFLPERCQFLITYFCRWRFVSQKASSLKISLGFFNPQITRLDLRLCGNVFGTSV